MFDALAWGRKKKKFLGFPCAYSFLLLPFVIITSRVTLLLITSLVAISSYVVDDTGSITLKLR